MPPIPLRRRHVLSGAAAATLLSATRTRAATSTGAATGQPLELVATFTSPRQVTGVAVSAQGPASS